MSTGLRSLGGDSLTLTAANTGYSWTPPYGAASIVVTVNNGGAQTWRWSTTEADVAAGTALCFAVPSLGSYVFTGPYDGRTDIWFASATAATVLAIAYDQLVQV